MIGDPVMEVNAYKYKNSRRVALNFIMPYEDMVTLFNAMRMLSRQTASMTMFIYPILDELSWCLFGWSYEDNLKIDEYNPGEER